MIQSANADVLKLALIALRKRIKAENLKVQLHLPIHDEILSSCPPEFAEEWKGIQEEEMIKAAGIYVDTDAVSVDSKILLKWQK